MDLFWEEQLAHDKERRDRIEFLSLSTAAMVDDIFLYVGLDPKTSKMRTFFFHVFVFLVWCLSSVENVQVQTWRFIYVNGYHLINRMTPHLKALYVFLLLSFLIPFRCFAMFGCSFINGIFSFVNDHYLFSTITLVILVKMMF